MPPDFAPLRARMLRDVRGPFQRSEAPRYPFSVEEALDTLERLLAHRTGDKELDDTGPDLIRGLEEYFREHSLTNLPERCEAFARLVLRLTDRRAWEALPPKDGLSALIKRLDLAGNEVLGANGLAELEGKPRFAIHVGRVVVARNESAHKAVERSTKEVAEVGESVLVFLLYTVCEHRERLELTLFRERVRAAAEEVRRRFAKWESRHVPLEGREREAAGENENIGLQLTARELLHDPADLADPDDEDDDGDDEDEDWEADGGSSQAARSGPILDLVREEPRLVLLGEPGAGKTTSLQFLAWDSAGALLDEAAVGDLLAAFPVFIALQRCKAQSGQALEDHLARELPDGWTLADLGRGTGTWLLLLDGFNEVGADYRDRLAADIRDLMERWPRVRMIVSSRPGVYHDAFRCPAFVLDALDDVRIREFLEKFFAQAGKPREADRFHEILSRHPRLKAWGRNPLGLRMLAAVGLRTGDLPANRGRLMESFVGTILAREADKERQQWDAPLKTFFLGHLAFETRRSGRVGFTWEEACGILRTVAERIGHSLDGPAFLRECEYNHLLASAGGLRDQGRAFAHEMYQEYFAAVELLRRRGEEPGLVDALRRDPFWEEPLILFAGLAPDGDEVIRAMGRDQPLLAARSLTSQLIPAAEVQADVVVRAEEEARRFEDAKRSSAGLLALVELGEMDRLQRIFGEIRTPTKIHKTVVERAVTQLELEPAVRFLLALGAVKKPVLSRVAGNRFVAVLDRKLASALQVQRSEDASSWVAKDVWPLLRLGGGHGVIAGLALARVCGLLERLDADRLLHEVVWPLLLTLRPSGLDGALCVVQEFGLLERLDNERVLAEVVWPLLRSGRGPAVNRALAVARACGLLERLDREELLSQVFWPLLKSRKDSRVRAALVLARECVLLERLDLDRVLAKVVWPLLGSRRGVEVVRGLLVAREYGLLKRLEPERLAFEVVPRLLELPNGAGVSGALAVVRECGLVRRLDPERIREGILEPLREIGTKAARAGIVEIEKELASVQAAAAADEVSVRSPPALPDTAPAFVAAPHELNGSPAESAHLAEPSPEEQPASIPEVTTQVTVPPLPPPPPPVAEETPPATGGWFSWWRRRPKA